jgi:glycosyltransferase involved in cell wall biosynthesis
MRTRRRVLIIVENLPVPFDRRVWCEARALRDAGYQVVVICPRRPRSAASREFLDGIYIYRHPLPNEGHGTVAYGREYGSALFWQFVYSNFALMRHGFDVIHGCNPPDLVFLIAVWFKFLFGKLYVFDHHDLCPELFEAKFEKRGFLWRLLVVFERLNFASADLSIATNESYRQVAVTRGNMSADKVHIVRSGPDLNKFKPAEANERWKAGRRYLVAYVGVIGEQEGMDLLVDSIEHVIRTFARSDVQFLVIGSGPALSGTKELVRKRKLQEFVQFTGRVDDAVLLEALSSADICVNPDRPNAMNDKSTMNKIMEYMALGKPIVQYDLLEGRVSAADASVYAARNDTRDFAMKIIELLDDAALRLRMGDVGLKRVRDTLSWEHEVPKLLNAYDAVFSLKKHYRTSWFTR